MEHSDTERDMTYLFKNLKWYFNLEGHCSKTYHYVMCILLPQLILRLVGL